MNKGKGVDDEDILGEERNNCLGSIYMSYLSNFA